jgi:hypothetical protein
MPPYKQRQISSRTLDRRVRMLRCGGVWGSYRKICIIPEEQEMEGYQSKPFWFHDQMIALPNSPAGSANKRSILWAQEDSRPVDVADPMIPFVCTEVFESIFQAEIDNYSFINCE